MTWEIATDGEDDVDEEVLADAKTSGDGQRWEEEAEDHNEQRPSVMTTGTVVDFAIGFAWCASPGKVAEEAHG